MGNTLARKSNMKVPRPKGGNLARRGNYFDSGPVMDFSITKSPNKEVKRPKYARRQPK
jgi:hypothetical protein